MRKSKNKSDKNGVKLNAPQEIEVLFLPEEFRTKKQTSQKKMRHAKEAPAIKAAIEFAVWYLQQQPSGKNIPAMSFMAWEPMYGRTTQSGTIDTSDKVVGYKYETSNFRGEYIDKWYWRLDYDPVKGIHLNFGNLARQNNLKFFVKVTDPCLQQLKESRSGSGMSNEEKLVAKYHIAMTNKQHEFDRKNANTQMELNNRESSSASALSIRIEQEKPNIATSNTVVAEKQASTQKKVSSPKEEKTSNITDQSEKTVSTLIANSNLFNKVDSSSSRDNESSNTTSISSEQESYMKSFCNFL